MYIIVVGAGKVGYYLTRELLNQGHEVLVIEKDPRKTEGTAEELGSIVMRGDGCEARDQAEAGAERADMVIAVTGDDEDNLVVCQVAKRKFNVPRTIARLNNPKNEAIFKRLGIDVTVSSTNAILERIEQELPTHPVLHLLSLSRWGLELTEVRVLPFSRAAGKRIQDLRLPADSRITLVVNRESGPQLPAPDLLLGPDDEVVAVTSPASEDALRALFSSP